METRRRGRVYFMWKHLWNLGADPYRAGPGPIVQSYLTPSRRTLLLYRQRAVRARISLVVVGLLLAALPVSRTTIAGLVAAVLAYLAWLLALRLVEQKVTPHKNVAYYIRVGRKVVVILVILALLLVPAIARDLWLLLLVPIVAVGTDLERRATTFVVLLAAAVAFFSAFPPEALPTPDSWLQGRDGLIRALTCCFVGFYNYLMVRSIAYQQAATGTLTNSLLALPANRRWEAASEVARQLAAIFSDEQQSVIVNVLLHDPVEDRLQVVGSSIDDPSRIVGYLIPQGEGLTSWVLRTGDPCFINDTAYDPACRFLPHPAFGSVRSAVAVPFRLEDGRTLVLDLESREPNAFAYEDLQLLQQAASHLAARDGLASRMGALEHLIGLSQRVGHESISDLADVDRLIDEVATETLALLTADVIGVYYRDPRDGSILQRRTIGNLLCAHAPNSPVNDDDNIVHQIMESTSQEIRLYPRAQEVLALTRWRSWHHDHDIAPFVVREKIVSCAAMPLSAAGEIVGLLWVNYRTEQGFPPRLQSLIQLVAPIIALAIQGRLQVELAAARGEAAERQRVQDYVHNTIFHRLRGGLTALDAAKRAECGSPDWRDSHFLSWQYVQLALGAAERLHAGEHHLTLADVITDLEQHIEAIRRLYRADIRLAVEALPHIRLGLTRGNELLAVLDEAVYNALRHANCNTIWVEVTVAEDQLRCTIRDDGQGFDLGSISRLSGVANIPRRIAWIGGQAEIVTEPGAGTIITIDLPLPREQGGEG